jgi:hypothetical protein
MATGPKKYRGSICKGDCSGHRAGYRYAKAGGVTPSPHSSSFNNGLAIGQRAIANKAARAASRTRRTP